MSANEWMAIYMLSTTGAVAFLFYAVIGLQGYVFRLQCRVLDLMNLGAADRQKKAREIQQEQCGKPREAGTEKRITDVDLSLPGDSS